ncbi:hypothetical protein U1Q18_042849 [Sarracenia purpurea var. burkii]
MCMEIAVSAVDDLEAKDVDEANFLKDRNVVTMMICNLLVEYLNLHEFDHNSENCHAMCMEIAVSAVDDLEAKDVDEANFLKDRNVVTMMICNLLVEYLNLHEFDHNSENCHAMCMEIAVSAVDDLEAKDVDEANFLKDRNVVTMMICNLLVEYLNLHEFDHNSEKCKTHFHPCNSNSENTGS